MTPTGSAAYIQLQGIISALRADRDSDTAGRMESDISAILADNPGVVGEMLLVRYLETYITAGQFLKEELTSFRMIKLVHA